MKPIPFPKEKAPTPKPTDTAPEMGEVIHTPTTPDALLEPVAIIAVGVLFLWAVLSVIDVARF